MNTKKGEKKVFTYSVPDPIHLDGLDSKSFMRILMGNVWTKANMRDMFKEKFGYSEVTEEQLCDIGCEMCMLCIIDPLDIDEE